MTSCIGRRFALIVAAFVVVSFTGPHAAVADEDEEEQGDPKPVPSLLSCPDNMHVSGDQCVESEDGKTEDTEGSTSVGSTPDSCVNEDLCD